LELVALGESSFTQEFSLQVSFDRDLSVELGDLLLNDGVNRLLLLL
jgi:hypothetical protein